MADDIAVDFDILAEHATRIDRIAADINMAGQAAASTDIGGGAFGLMCAFMVPPVSLVATQARNTIAAAADMVERSAVQIRGLSQDFQEMERAGQQMFDEIRETGLGR